MENLPTMLKRIVLKFYLYTFYNKKKLNYGIFTIFSFNDSMFLNEAMLPYSHFKTQRPYVCFKLESTISPSEQS